MAREELDREDLLAEATALSRRAEFNLAGLPQPMVAGFRSNGCASFYFGSDPVYHFNSRRELRRAYSGGRLYKAERHRLVALTRQRRGREMQLLRHELPPTEAAAFLQSAWAQLAQVREAMEQLAFQVIGQVPPGGDTIVQVRDWLRALASPLQVAAKPNAV